MNIDQLAPDEPLSPELVLVLSPELRAQVLAGFGTPVWPRPRPGTAEAPTSAVGEPLARSVGGLLVARLARLALVFVAVTILTLALSLVAQAMR